MGFARSRTTATALVVAFLGASVLSAGGEAEASAIRPSGATPAPRIVEPRSGKLVTGDRVRVHVRNVGPGFRAVVRDRDITSRFKPAPKGGGLVAILRRGRDLVAGSHRLVVSSGTGTGRQHSARWFVLGRRQKGSLKVSRAPAGKTSLKVRFRGPRNRFESVWIRLNGKRVRTRDWVTGRRHPSSKWPHDRRRFTALFGVNDGLRFGKNRLAAVAWRSDGFFDRSSVTVRLPRKGALAGAGEGHKVPAGRRVRLDGSASKSKGKVDHRWELVRSPDGSEAKLRRVRTARPRLRPDVPGTYRIRLSASASPAAVDEVAVQALPPVGPIGPTIQTITPGGAIEVAGTEYTTDSPWVQMLVLDRQTLEVKSNQAFGPKGTITTDDVNLLFDAISGVPTTRLVVLSGGNRNVDLDLADFRLLTAVEDVITVAGGDVGGINSWRDLWVDMLEQGRWSLIGVPNTPDSATQNLFGMLYGPSAADGSQPGAITGHMQLDSNDDFTFASANFVKVDTQVPGSPQGVNQIQIGEDVYTSDQIEAGESGFQVLILDSLLEVTEHQTFVTNDGSGETVGVQQLQELLSDQSGFGLGTPGYLFIVQSIGEPLGYSSNWVNDGALVEHTFGQDMNADVVRSNSVWYSDFSGESLASTIGTLGGPVAHDHVAQMIAPSAGQPDPSGVGGYTLIASTGQLVDGDDLLSVGPPGPLSRSQALSGSPDARVVGVLKRDDQSLWAAGRTAFYDQFSHGELETLMYQDPVPWPMATTAEQQAANRFISDHFKFGTPDVREAYYKKGIDDWDGLSTKVLDIPYPGDHFGFSEQVFEAMKDQLSTEMSDVGAVRFLITNGWQAIFSGSTTKGEIDLQTITGDVKKEITKIEDDQQGESQTWAIIGESLWVASSLFTLGDLDLVGDALGVGASAMDLGADLGETADGDALTAPVVAEADELGQEIAERYETIDANLGHVGDILVSDWGKLQMASSNATGPWAFSTTAMNDFRNTVQKTSDAEIWKSLLSIVYGVYVVDPPWVHHTWTQPGDIFCQTDEEEGIHPFADSAASPSSWMTAVAGFGDGIPEAVPFSFGLTTKADSNNDGWVLSHAESADDDWTEMLFEAPNAGGLGIDKLALFGDDRFQRWWFWCERQVGP